MAEQDEVVEQDFREAQTALQIVRTLNQLEPLLRKSMGAKQRLRTAEAQIKALEEIKANLNAAIAAERQTALEMWEEQKQIEVERHRATLERMTSDAEVQRMAALRDVAAAREEATRTRDKSARDLVVAKAELDRLAVTVKERSETMAAELAALRTQKERVAAEVKEANKGLLDEREALKREIASLKREEEAIRAQFSALLKATLER